jgi:hypothetical protein
MPIPVRLRGLRYTYYTRARACCAGGELPLRPKNSTADEGLVRKPHADTHQECRSLLQKAVRRGDADLALRVARHLQEIGDSAWLRGRVSVITFEECWPLGGMLPSRPDAAAATNVLTHVARSTKLKDAAGLGTLAYALSGGDRSVFIGVPEDRHIRVVEQAIQRPNDFWKWAASSTQSEIQRGLVEAAERSFRRGGWPWDRAFMQSAAYLAITTTIQSVQPGPTPARQFPLWVALDKHTPAGKKAIRDAARQLRIPVRQLSWLSFYFESAAANAMIDSYWWSREMAWRLSRVGLTRDKAAARWDEARPVVRSILVADAERLGHHLGNPDHGPGEIHAQAQLAFVDQTIECPE